MKIRLMRQRDFPGVKAVYRARAAVTSGLVRRTPGRWTMFRRQRLGKTLWLVAEDGGRIVGYAIGSHEKSFGDTGEVMWLPEYDGTALGGKLLDDMLRHLERTRPAAVIIWGMEDSPTFSLPMPPSFERTETTGVFMAGVTDVRLFLRDAKKILNERVKGRLQVKVTGRRVVVGTGRGPMMQASMDKEVLLGLLLGTRQLDEELKRGHVKVRPKGRAALDKLHTAFPAKHFHIEDGW